MHSQLLSYYQIALWCGTLHNGVYCVPIWTPDIRSARNHGRPASWHWTAVPHLQRQGMHVTNMKWRSSSYSCGSLIKIKIVLDMLRFILTSRLNSVHALNPLVGPANYIMPYPFHIMPYPFKPTCLIVIFICALCVAGWCARVKSRRSPLGCCDVERVWLVEFVSSIILPSVWCAFTPGQVVYCASDPGRGGFIFGAVQEYEIGVAVHCWSHKRGVRARTQPIGYVVGFRV